MKIMAVDEHLYLEGVPLAFKDSIRIKEFREDRTNKCIEFLHELTSDFLDQYNNVHGSALALLSVLAAENVAKTQIFGDEYLVAISHTINFVSQPETLADLEIRSCVIGKGGKIIHVQTTITCNGKELANALTVFVVEESV
ncbi:MAG: hotdog fold domain-containing protein [Ignisphaera sp.]